MPESSPGAAELEAAGLYDPEASDAAERLAFLEYLVGMGASLDDLLAHPQDELPIVASHLALWGVGEWLNLSEVADRAGVDVPRVARAWRAAGFPEPDQSVDLKAFSPRDVEMLEIIRAGGEWFGEEVTIQLVRVLGAAAARVADALVSAFMVHVAPQAAVHDPSGLELARANAESLVLLEGVSRGFDTLLRHHIERGFRPLDASRPMTDVDLVGRCIGFVDLVDSTAWTQQLDLPELSRALNDFDTLASEIVVGHGGRVVKLIGDEVMFVASDAAAAANIALALIDVFAGHAVLPAVRAGIATGEVLARDGDFSGAVVNLAARAVKVAEPSTLLVDRATRDALHDVVAFALGEERGHSVKGFADPVLLSRITRSERR